MKILVTGGAGFIGCHTCASFSSSGDEVVALDNLSRRGSVSNADWLKSEHGVTIHEADIRRFDQIEDCFRELGPFDAVIHLAAQVAVTTSVRDPREDFEINAAGTFNVLEGARTQSKPPIVLFASTNKVYGDGPNHVPLKELDTRWDYDDPAYADGIAEDFPIDHCLHSCVPA